MIQRIQSILLFFSALLMIVFLFVPVWEGSNKPGTKILSKENVHLNAFKLKKESVDSMDKKESSESNVLYIAVMAIVSALISLVTIFQFKNRTLQVKLCMFNSLIIIGTLGCVYLSIHNGKSMLSSLGDDNFMIGFLLPVVALILNVMANRFIRKDEKLVKSADRFR